MDKWQVVKTKTGDKLSFYYGVKTTGIVCLPSCKSKLPLRFLQLFSVLL